MAAALRDWLPDILHFVDPWMSDTDINAGQRWATEVGKTLEETNFGILCVTRENLAAPWLLFEAGALSKSLTQAAVIPLLLDINFSDINNGPLGQFQAKKLSKEECYEFVSAINVFFDNAIDPARLARIFERAWPALEDRLKSIPAEPNLTAKEQRPTHELLEDLLAGMSRIETRLSAREGEHVAPAKLLPVITSVEVDFLRRQIEQEVAARTLRRVAAETGMSAMGLRYFIHGERTPSARMIGKLQLWYAHRLYEQTRTLYRDSANEALSEEPGTKNEDGPSNPDEETP